MERAGMLALECHDLVKQFGGLSATDGVNLKVYTGERHALIGPNGAGKTTLFRLFSGELTPTTGIIRLFGRDVTHMPANKRAHLGLGRTFQITNIFHSLTVIENLIVAFMGLSRVKFSMLKPLSRYKAFYASAHEMLESVGMAEKENVTVRNLSHGEQRQVELSLALISRPKLLLLDEPTAGLSSAESAMMTKKITQLDPDITVIIIEHDMDVAFKVADRVSVLHRGSIFAQGGVEDIRKNPDVQKIYFGNN